MQILPKGNKEKRIFRRIWKVCSWTWIAIIIAIGVSFLANALSSGSTSFADNLFIHTVYPWFWVPAPLNVTVDVLLLFFMLLTIISGCYVLFMEQTILKNCIQL